MSKKNKKARPRLSNDEMEVVDKYRQEKRAHEALKKECEEKGIPYEDVNYYWHKSERFSINVSNAKVSFDSIFKDIIEDIQLYAPVYPKISYPKHKSNHLLVIDPADIHINKLASAVETGDEYNHQIAFMRVTEAINGLIARSSGFSIDKILLIIGNDILHVDNAANTTTGGTKQDVSLMWYDAFKLAQKLITQCIELLVQVAPVHVQYDPSNHDNTSGFYLAQTIEAWFHKNSNVTFNVSPAHRKYFRYHNNIIGTTHGDGAKEADLPMLMAHESKDWGECRHRYFYTHHIHHKRSRDYMSVTVESIRSPSGADSYHHKNGFVHAPKAVEAFLHHPEHGQIARFTHILG